MFKLNDHDRILLRLKQRTERDKQRYVKITALLMIDSGFSVAETAAALGVDDATVYRYLTLFKESDTVDDYLRLHYRGSSPALNQEQTESLLEELTGTLYRTAAAVAEFIRTRFSVTYSERGVRHLLHRLGFRFKKTRLVPAKADPNAQDHFLRRRLLPLLTRAQQRGEPVYFCDAVHPQYNTRASSGWISVAENWSVPSTSGRRRLNLHGALNSQNPSDLVVLCFEQINAASALALFDRLEQQHPEGRIHVVCDNASYYRSKEVRRGLRKRRIRLVFLPPYSPNLNLIERVWKYLRRTVIDTIYYATFAEFTEAILSFFANITEHEEALQSLLTPNFHIDHSLAI